MSEDDEARGHSSAGRASGLQPEGHRFDPGWLHQLRAPDNLQSRVFARVLATRVLFNNLKSFFDLTPMFKR